MITKLAIKNSVFSITAVVLMLLSGMLAFEEMPRDDMPPFLVRAVSIVASYPGASPERIENLVTDKIEKVVQEVAELDYVKSESRTGVSIINVAIKESEFDLQPIYDRLRRKVEDVQGELPEGTTVSFKDELGDVFGIIIGLTADGFSDSEMKDIADEIRDDLIRLPNVGKVELSGIQDEQIYIEFDASRLASLGLSQKKLQNILSATNIIVPGGSITVSGQVIIVEPTGSFETLQDLGDVIVENSGDAIVRLRDVATIRQAYIEPRKTRVAINGKPGIAIAVNLIAGGNIISMGQQLDQRINHYLKTYPHGVDIVRVASQDYVVEQSVNDFIGNLVQSIAVVMLVMLFFLSLRTGLVVASLIPVTLVVTLLLMSVFEVGLNKVTLASLIIALGMLVDNAIVMSESILVKMERGMAALEAALASSRELLVPLLTSSLTTSAAFMAFYLAESVLGEIMGNIFIVLTFALLSSWLLTVTFITLISISILRVGSKQTEEAGFFDKVSNYYKNILTLGLRKPVATISIIFIIFCFSVYGMRFVPNIFMAKSDRALVTVNIELPLGYDINTTQGVVDKIESMVEAKLYVDSLENQLEGEGVANWSSYVGMGAPKYDLGYTAPESSPHAAHILLNTSSESINDTVIEVVENYIFEHFPDVSYKVSRLVSGGGAANPIEVRLSGNDIGELYRRAAQVKTLLREIPGTKGVSDDWGMQSKKIVVDINPSSAQIAGFSNQDVAESLQTVLAGKKTGSLRFGEKVIPIVMQDETSQKVSIEELESLNVYAQQSEKNIPLRQIADVNIEWQISKIIRRDLSRTITVIADVQTGFTAAQIVDLLVPQLNEAKANWPEGFEYALGGDAEGGSSAMGAVIDKIPLSIGIIVLLLIAQFNSIRKPFIILATIPLGLIGVIAGLLITGSYFGFMAFLGIISLAGIVINNAIVLLDRIEIEQ